MSTVTMTRQTSLSGRALQEAVLAMVDQLRGMRPYSMLNISRAWEGGSRLTLQAGRHMTGAITLQSGNPSTVTAQINLLSTIAQAQRPDLEQHMASLAARHLGGATTAQAPAATTPTGTAPVPGTSTTTQQQTSTTRPRRTFDWSGFTTLFSGILGGVTEGLDAYGSSFEQEAADEAVAVVKGEVTAQTGKETYTGPIDPADDTPWQQFTEMITGTPSTPPAAPAGAGAAGQTRQAAGFPTWGWVAIGIGGVAMLGILVWAVSGSGDDERRDDDDDYRPRRPRFDDDEIRENYGFRYFF